MSVYLKRLAVAVAVFLISGSAVLVATFFFFAAIYFWFNEFLLPAPAALATAGCLLGFALIIILLGAMVASSFKRQPRRRFEWLVDLLNAPEGISAAAIGNALGRRLALFAQDNTKGAVIATFLVGLFLGISPGLRALLRDVLKD
jgi:hypothetical protein